MATITLGFNNPLPEGIQVGDTAYYLDISSQLEVKMGSDLSTWSQPGPR